MLIKKRITSLEAEEAQTSIVKPAIQKLLESFDWNHAILWLKYYLSVQSFEFTMILNFKIGAKILLNLKNSACDYDIDFFDCFPTSIIITIL